MSVQIATQIALQWPTARQCARWQPHPSAGTDPRNKHTNLHCIPTATPHTADGFASSHHWLTARITPLMWTPLSSRTASFAIPLGLFHALGALPAWPTHFAHSHFHPFFSQFLPNLSLLPALSDSIRSLFDRVISYRKSTPGIKKELTLALPLCLIWVATAPNDH